MKVKYVEIDFEFNNSKESPLRLVCCSLRPILEDKTKLPIEEYWLFDGEDKYKLYDRILSLSIGGATFLAHQVLAEARSCYALDFNPASITWIDTLIEWRQITNHHRPLRYGKHLIDGKEKNLIPPKFDKWKDDDSKDKLKHGLAEMVYKLLGKRIDITEKEEVRDIIIHGTDEEIRANRERIQRYCSSDIIYLYDSLAKIMKESKRVLSKDHFKLLLPQMKERGNQMAIISLIEERGYPIQVENTKNFAKQVPTILKQIQEDINEQFPDMGVFHLDKKTRKYTKKEKPIQAWIDEQPFAGQWPLTDSGKYSLALDSFAKFFNYRHEYPRGNFGAQMLRLLKTKQSLNGFVPSSTKKKGKKSSTFLDYIGSDGRVRPYLNPYGSQSGRFQPGSTGFLFLKAAWMRSLCVPPRGKAIVGIDYKSQEYLIAALMSGDEAMIQSYKTGDVYMAYAIASGLAPKGATKKTHPKERDISKPVVLGINYDMSKYGLANDMSEKIGEEVTPDEAQTYIDAFFDEYYKFNAFKEWVLNTYELEGYLQSPNGWTMYGDNFNFRSVGNFPVQSAGSSILLKAIELCHLRGLEVIIPLHDALYIEVEVDKLKEKSELFEKCMVDAFDFYFPNSGVMLDAEAWSPELSEGKLKLNSGLEVKLESIHIDERSSQEYERFKRYFEIPESDYL